MFDDLRLIVLAAVTLLAAVVNGGLGYGFSSITVPVALIFYANRILNPALVLVEVALNGYLLFINRKSVPLAWKRVIPLLAGLFVGVIAGSQLLSRANPEWLKFFTYATVLPLILLQAAGMRRPIQAERLIGVPFGAGVGVLYSLTTISGPPLALMFNNQGYVKEEFRACLGIIRVAESSLTAIAYYWLGRRGQQRNSRFNHAQCCHRHSSGRLPCRQMPMETFRRICMSFDAWIVGFGLSRVLIVLQLLGSPAAYGVWLSIAIFDLYLLYLFFWRGQSAMFAAQSAGEASG
jgi:uncharacterized protein